ncbi:ribonuclease HIII [Mycoplasmopsis lipofaciens]|uniref:ribonuclease HIII n=1 Tax=Mycoplasmopsis lipofaciens TaxID=114884 RepID=UPI0004869AD2|nr:ribonuclease HIII [Mycoplasmopsis lipofaciens]
MKFIEYNFSIKLDDKNVIGVDEVGVGDYFGPLVSAAVFIPRENRQKLIDLGVKDSKKITDTKILEIAYKIKQLTKYAIHHLSPKGYNVLNKSYNANYLKMFTHLSSISQLQKTLSQIDFVFIDKYSNSKSIEKYFINLMKTNNWAKFPEIKGDILLAYKGESVSLEIACASILAREYFLNFMKKMNEQYNTIFPLGASNKVKEFAKTFFKNHPNIQKNDVCKKSFKMDLEEDTQQVTLF